MKKTKSVKAITLISLVITIIIIIILAGVIINLTLGEGGLINRTLTARDKYINEQEKEENSLNELYSKMLIATNDSSQITVNIEELREIIKTEIKEEKLNMYPVGSIYMSTSNINPSELFGGEWENYAEGKTLIGAGTGTDINSQTMQFVANTTGGEYYHRLTIAEMPTHSHKTLSSGSAATVYYESGGNGIWLDSASLSTIYSSYTGNQGGGESHNNIQPYIVTYMWRRIK